ncbi:hypothetical protein AVEN_90900-1 [Araneus ventricosus]|uniref:Uncharacterized protein n=1 Tax=Araneus ventricosus TaxID=182803 RepID=A0A4Y2RN70_ARAVE|nr:hypothetical protein AVEN_90900-1 [Araneus ventricosus]
MDRTRLPKCLAPRSPDPLHWIFFFCGYIKNKVYAREISNIEDVRASITAAIATVTTERLQRTWVELDYRLDILRTIKGAHAVVH